MEHDAEYYARFRERMVRDQIERRGVKDPRVLEACRSVERHLFVLPQDRNFSYEDYPLPIGFGQTISQPYIVAFMAEQLQLTPSDAVLEIGTGSGYAAAIFAELAGSVHTIEIVQELYERASGLLRQLHYKNIVCMLRDGYAGVPEHAPFDKIVLTAAPEVVPTALLEQLKVGGLLLAPLGSIRMFQRMSIFEKLGPLKFKETELMGVSFVEMVHAAIGR